MCSDQLRRAALGLWRCYLCNRCSWTGAEPEQCTCCQRKDRPIECMYKLSFVPSWIHHVHGEWGGGRGLYRQACRGGVHHLRDLQSRAEEESSGEEMVGQEPEEASGGSSGVEGGSPTSGRYTGPSAGCTAVSTALWPHPGPATLRTCSTTNHREAPVKQPGQHPLVMPQSPVAWRNPRKRRHSCALRAQVAALWRGSSLWIAVAAEFCSAKSCRT